jgi:hypothetical protein
VAKRKQAKAKKVWPTSETVVAPYLALFKAAGMRPSEFDAVFAALSADKAAKTAEVLAIASGFVGFPVHPRTRDGALEVIKRKFVEQLRFEREHGT